MIEIQTGFTFLELTTVKALVRGPGRRIALIENAKRALSTVKRLKDRLDDGVTRERIEGQLAELERAINSL